MRRLPAAQTRTVKGLLLDADGVVQLPGPAWRTSLEGLCGQAERAEAFLADVFAAERPCLTGSADFAASLAAVLDRWGSPASVAEALRIWTHIDPCADVLDLVGALRSAGTPVALATNQQAHRAAFMSHGLGYAERFDHLLYSCELGHAKPSTEYFARALEVVGVPAADALFIDDHETNVLAARECGLNAEVFHVADGIGRFRAILDAYGLSPGRPQSPADTAGERP